MHDPIGLGTPAWEYSHAAARQIALMLKELTTHNASFELQTKWLEHTIRDAKEGVLSDDDTLEV